MSSIDSGNSLIDEMTDSDSDQSGLGNTRRIKRKYSKEQNKSPEQTVEPKRRISRHMSSLNQSLGDSTQGYEELFKNSIPCPTCDGLGRIPKEKENEFVALIPMKDGRLKPRRTRCYVALAVLITLVSAGVTVFLLIPRDIHITSSSPDVFPNGCVMLNITVPFINFTITNDFNVSNHNYYAVKLTSSDMLAQYGSATIANVVENQEVTIPSRSSSTVALVMDIYTQREVIATLCERELSIPLAFLFTTNYSTWLGYSAQQTLPTYQIVHCRPSEPNEEDADNSLRFKTN